MFGNISDQAKTKDYSESLQKLENARLITILALAKLAEYRFDTT